MQLAHPSPGEQRHLDGSQQLRATERGARWIQHLDPPPQLLHRKNIQLPLQRPSSLGIHRRLVEQLAEERAEVEPRPPDDDRHPALRLRVADPAIRFGCPPGSRGTLDRLQHVDPVVRRGQLVAHRGLGGADVEASIHLPRVGADHGDVGDARAQRRRIGLARRRRSADHANGGACLLTGGQSGARARATTAARSSTGHGRRAPAASSRRARRTARASRPGTSRRPP